MMKRLAFAVSAVALLATAVTPTDPSSASPPANISSDVAGVVFAPSPVALTKGGHAVPVTATFNGTANANDGGSVKFNVTESDPVADDPLLTISKSRS